MAMFRWLMCVAGIVAFTIIMPWYILALLVVVAIACAFLHAITLPRDMEGYN